MTEYELEQEIIEQATRVEEKRNALLFDYYVTKLRRELELGIINIYTFPAFFYADSRAAEFRSRITVAVLGQEKAILLGLYNPDEGKEDDDDDMNLSEDELDLFFGDDDIDEGLPLGLFMQGEMHTQADEVVQ